MTRPLTGDQVVARIRAMAAELGRPPREREPGAPDYPARRIFGSWANAIEAAGFPRPAPAVQKRAGGPRTAAILNQFERSLYGFTATIREQHSDRIEVHHCPGIPLETLRAFMIELDERGENEGTDWRLLSYSTPNTIFADLLVTRDGDGKRTRQVVEAHVLSRIGRLDRIDPSLEMPGSRRRRTYERQGDAWREGGAGYWGSRGIGRR